MFRECYEQIEDRLGNVAVVVNNAACFDDTDWKKLIDTNLVSSVLSGFNVLIKLTKPLNNKKVLLCERKKHAARRIVRTRSAALSLGRGGGGYTHSVLMRKDGYHLSGRMGGTPRCEQTDNITFPHPSDAGGN